jgi:predicted nucleic acid-binding protein
MALNAVVVSDSTTLISLLNMKRFELLFLFSNTIVITPAVYSEVVFKQYAKEILDTYIEDAKVIVEEVHGTQKVKELLVRLDLGESESIVLANEKQIPLIIDEKRGKRVAKALGIDVIGLIGILLVYKKRGYLSNDEIVEIVEALKEVNFRISSKLLTLLLEA